MTELSIVIPTLGQSQFLPKLLESISSQSLISSIEVLIVDNSQDPSVKDALQNLSQRFNTLRVRLFHIQERGVNYARNKGLSESLGNIIFFLDDDCWIKDPQLLKKHLQFHKSNPELFAVGGLYRLGQSPAFIEQSYHAMQMRWLYEGQGEDGLSRHLIGGHFSIKREVSQRHGLRFNETIQYGGSELGFFLQAYRQGLKMKLETIDIIHETHMDLKTLTKKVYKQGRGKALLDQDLVLLDQSSKWSEVNSWSHRSMAYYLGFVFQIGFFKQLHPKRSLIRIILQIAAQELKHSRDMSIRWLDQQTQKSKKDL